MNHIRDAQPMRITDEPCSITKYAGTLPIHERQTESVYSASIVTLRTARENNGLTKTCGHVSFRLCRQVCSNARLRYVWLSDPFTRSTWLPALFAPSLRAGDTDLVHLWYTMKARAFVTHWNCICPPDPSNDRSHLTGGAKGAGSHAVRLSRLSR